MTLTQAAKLTKRGMIFTVLTIFLGLSAWFGYRYYYYNIYLPSLPKVEEKPNLKFGLLPQLQFDSTSVSSSNFSYSLDTVTGNVPTKFPKIMKVYFAVAGNTTLLSSDRANNLARNFLFPTGPERLTPTQYKFIDSIGGEFLIDLNTGNFKFQRPEASTSSELTKQPFDTEQRLKNEFRDYLANKISLSGINGRTNAIFDQETPRESSTARVSIWPSDINDYKIMTPKYEESSVRATITNFKDPEYRFRSLNFVYWPIDKNTSATYYIRTAEQAFADLKTGQGSVVRSPTNSGTASITNIYLAYYQQEEYTPYIQPIYVFEGEEFMAYVPAIDKQFISP